MNLGQTANPLELAWGATLPKPPDHRKPPALRTQRLEPWAPAAPATEAELVLSGAAAAKVKRALHLQGWSALTIQLVSWFWGPQESFTGCLHGARPLRS